MEWHTVIASALGSSPVGILSFYWANKAWNAKEKSEAACALSLEKKDEDHQQELAKKDSIIATKDAQIAALQESRLADLRAVMRVTPEPARTPQKPSGSKSPF